MNVGFGSDGPSFEIRVKNQDPLLVLWGLGLEVMDWGSVARFKVNEGLGFGGQGIMLWRQSLRSCPQQVFSVSPYLGNFFRNRTPDSEIGLHSLGPVLGLQPLNP